MKKIKMTEKAYIARGDLVNIQRALDVLGSIAIDNSNEYISPDEYQTVMSILYRWADKLYSRIETTGEV